MNAQRGKIGAGVLLVVLACLAAYGPALQAGFIWDDDAYVLENETLRSAGGLARIWFEPGATPQYYPLVFTSFWVEHQLWGSSPFGYHLVNVLLHAASALLLWRALRLLAVPGAFVAAAVFALHPVMVESVAWITERKNVLSGLFYLAALLACLRFTGLDGSAEDAGRRKAWWWALGLFACALLAKTVTATLPAAVLLLVWWKRGRITAADGKPLLPMFALGLALAAVTVWLERTHVGTQVVNLGLSPDERVLIAGRALWFYAGKLLWPAGLAFIYPRWALDPGAPLQWLYPLAALGMLILAWALRKRMGRGPLTALLFFAGTLVPALGFIDVFPMMYSFVADHFQYLAAIGPIVLVVAAAARGLRAAGTAAKAGPVAAALLLAGLGFLASQQARAYHDLETLWLDTIEKNPAAIMARINLGNLYKREGRLAESTALLRQAAATDPALAHPRILARAHYNLGNNVGQERRFEEAVGMYQRALVLDPGYFNARKGLGWAYRSLRRWEDSAREYRRYLSYVPGDAAARQALEAVEKQARRR